MCRQDIVYDKKIKLRSTDPFLTAMVIYCIYRSCMELPHESPAIKCINIPGRPDGSSIYVSEKEDYMLYALLNGGAPYLVREGAYPNTDGAFEDRVEMTLEECISRAKVVSDLHEKVGKCEMVRHEFVEGNPQIQKTVFSNGISVQVDFQKQTYEIRNEGMNG